MAKHTKQRLLSLDALRGFDMFWIIGGASIFRALARVTDSRLLDWIKIQTFHADWNGFRFFDLIFPLFLFIAGVSYPYSLESRKEKGQTGRDIVKHIIRRGLILVLLGIVYNGILVNSLNEIRYASVLGRIGLAWMFAALIVLYLKPRWQIILFVFFLVVYNALMVFIPVPGYGAGVLTLEGSLASYIDQLLLPGKLYFGSLDPEGILSTIPAISTALLGMFTGQFLKTSNKHFSEPRKFYYMIGSGVILILLSLIWNLFFPINKNLWSSSFVLCTGGISLILLSIFYLILDIWKVRAWAFPFVVIGLNPITIYMVQKIIDIEYTNNYLFGSIINQYSGRFNDFWEAMTYFIISWLFLYFLHKRKIYFKV